MITIDRINNDYRIAGQPDARAQLAKRLDHVVSDKLIAALERAALDFADENGAVYRVRRLDLRLWLNASRLNDAEIAHNWARALAQALHRQILDAEPDNVIHYPSQAAFLATWVGDILGQGVNGKWQYAEFDELHDLPAGQAIALGLMRDPRWIAPVFQLLSANRKSARFVAAMMPHDVSVLWYAWVGAVPQLQNEVPLALVQSALALRPDPPEFERGGAASRARMALRWLMALCLGRDGLPAPVGARLAMQLGHLGAALQIVPALGPLLASRAPDRTDLRVLLAQLPDDLGQTRKWITQLTLQPGSAKNRAALVQLHSGSFAKTTKTAVAPKREDKVISAYSGVGLLLPVLRDLDLWAPLGPAGRVAVLAQAMTGAARLLAQADTGLRWMAGLPDNVLLDDHLHAINWPRGAPLTDADKTSHGDTPQTEVLRGLLDRFSRDLRGMSGSSMAYLCAQFLVRPGTLIRTEKSLVIRVESVPLKVLLQLSGRLGDQGVLPWLNDAALRLDVCDG